MPAKTRRRMHDLGAVTAPGQSISVDLEASTKGILHAAGSGAVIDVQVSPDGGATWHDLYDQADAKVTFTLGATPESHQINPSGRLLRIDVITANVTACYFEAIKEIA